MKVINCCRSGYTHQEPEWAIRPLKKRMDMLAPIMDFFLSFCFLWIEIRTQSLTISSKAIFRLLAGLESSVSTSAAGWSSRARTGDS